MGRSKAKQLDTAPSDTGIIARLAFALAEEKGADVEALLRKSGLSRKQVHDLNAPLKVRSEIIFLDLVAEAVGDDLIGFHLSQEDRIIFGAKSTHELEIATLERPRRLHLLSHPNLHFELDHLIDGVYGGSCRMMLILRSRPTSAPEQTLQPLMAPFMGVTLRDELEQDLSDLATAVRRHASVS